MDTRRQDSKKRKRAAYRLRKEKHLCVDCGKPLAPDACRVRCEVCGSRKNKGQGKRKAASQLAAVALGLCRYCRNEAVEGLTVCGYHAEYHSEANLIYYHRVRAEAESRGDCKECCKRKPVAGKKMCAECQAVKRKAWLLKQKRKQLAAQGLALLPNKAS